MNKIKVAIETCKDCSVFVQIANSINEDVYLQDGAGLKVNAKSLMGVMYGTSEFSQLFVLSEHDNLSGKFLKFLI